MKNLQENAVSLLIDLKQVLADIDSSHYSLPTPQLSNASVGQHTRHIIEFFQCLIDQTQDGIINYGLRKRDLEMEEQKTAAIEAINQVILNLNRISGNTSLILEINEDETYTIPTNTKRELFYNIEHAIHHMAMIKIGLKIISPGVALPENFGVAPSTVRFRMKREEVNKG